MTGFVQRVLCSDGPRGRALGLDYCGCRGACVALAGRMSRLFLPFPSGLFSCLVGVRGDFLFGVCLVWCFVPLWVDVGIW